MGRFIWIDLEFPSVTMIGRLSKLRVVRVRHSEYNAMWENDIVRSGEVGSLREGPRVGESSLRRRKRSEFMKYFVIKVPPASVSIQVHVV